MPRPKSGAERRKKQRIQLTRGIIARLGTLGVVIRARREGRIPSAASVMAELRRVGLRLDDSLLRQVLRQFADEDWEP